jgi:hypothetical protein
LFLNIQHVRPTYADLRPYISLDINRIHNIIGFVELSRIADFGLGHILIGMNSYGLKYGYIKDNGWLGRKFYHDICQSTNQIARLEGGVGQPTPSQIQLRPPQF